MNLAHPHFAEPQWLWLAVLGPLVLLALAALFGLGAAQAIGATGRAGVRGAN